MQYQVCRLKQPLKIDANWNKLPWKDITPIEINNYMGKEPEHKPGTLAKIAYDEKAIYVIFQVENRYVRAVARKRQDNVCFDSCVEFFFTPGKDVSIGYFNIEINCGGTMLFYYHQLACCKDSRPLAAIDCDKVEIAHSLPKIIDPEIKESTTWTIEYRFPYDILAKYCAIKKPAPGVMWRANLYKCADKTSHPHWLTWSKVDFPEPKFHVPKCFGILKFE